MSVMQMFVNKFDLSYSKMRKELDERSENIRVREKRVTEQEKCLVRMINPDRICPNRSKIRTVFDDESMYSLADSIREYGILQPITIRKLSDESEPFGGLYELVAGERRLRASKIAGLKYVPCIIIDADEEESAKFSLIENVQRKDLNIFDEAMGFYILCDKYELTQQEAASCVGVSQSYVANKIRLLKYSEHEKSIILKYGLTERHARALLRIEDIEVRTKLLTTIAQRGYNVNQTEELVVKLLSGAKSRPVRKLLLKDIRIFLNSVDRAVDMIKEAGFDIEQSKREEGEFVELVIKIPKNKYTDI